MILAQVCEDHPTVLIWTLWIHKRESVRTEYVPNILNAFVHIANENLAEEKIVTWYAKLNELIDTMSRLQTLGTGPSILKHNRVRGNTLVVCPSIMVSKVLRRAKHHELSAVELTSSFQAMYSEAIHEDVVVIPPHRIGNVKPMTFDRVIVWVEKHAFYISSLPPTQKAWIIKTSNNLTEREKNFLHIYDTRLGSHTVNMNDYITLS